MKKITLFIIMCIIVSSLAGIGVSAATFSGEGSGTADAPYIITTADQFEEIANFPSAVFELNAPEGITLYNPTPIKAFKGTLKGVDGANEITVQIKRADTTYNPTLFQYVDDGVVIDNLVIKGTIEGGNSIYTSALIGYINRGITATISNIINYADITINYALDDVKSGGIIGMIYNNSSTLGNIKVENCKNYGTITYSSETMNTADFGGIIGRIGTGTDTVIVSGCENYGQINGGGGRFGGIVGISAGPNVTIDNCHNYGVLSGNNDIGGIVGYAQNTLTVSKCTNNASITSNYTITDSAAVKSTYVGGIVGQIKTNSKIEECTNNADGTIEVKVSDDAVADSSACFYLGGIAGHINSCVTVQESKNFGTVGGTRSNIDAYFFCGGIAGCNLGSTITMCSNHGDSIKKTRQFGGIAGRLSSQGTISESYNTAKIQSTRDNGYSGGIVARIDDTTCLIENCYNTGTMLSVTYTGGLVGYANSGGIIKNSYSIQPEKPAGDALSGNTNTTIENVYFNNFDGIRNDKNGTGLTAVELTDASAYANFDFTDVWMIKDVEANTDYPFPQLKNNSHYTDYTDMYKVTVTVEKNGEETTDVFYIKGGSTYAMDIQPEEGLMISELKYNDSSVLGNDTQYITPEITQNSTIYVQYVPASFELNESFANGTSYMGAGESILIDGVEYNDYIVSLSRFANYVGYEVVEFGIDFSTNKDFADAINVKAEKKWSDNSFGVLIYGTGLQSGNTYYLKPYAVYKNILSSSQTAKVYGTVQTVNYVKE